MLYQYFVAPLAAFFSWLVLSEPFTLVQLFGAGLVIVGVLRSSGSWRRLSAAEVDERASPRRTGS
jgi:drug/metabolite transporter (DMT)-like permease